MFIIYIREKWRIYCGYLYVTRNIVIKIVYVYKEE